MTKKRRSTQRTGNRTRTPGGRHTWLRLRVTLAAAIAVSAIATGTSPAAAEETPAGPAATPASTEPDAGTAPGAASTSTKLELDRASAAVDEGPIVATVRVTAMEGAGLEGEVFVVVDGQELAPALLSPDGTASFELPVSEVGEHAVTARYAPAGSALASASGTQTFTVRQAANDPTAAATTGAAGDVDVDDPSGDPTVDDPNQDGSDQDGSGGEEPQSGGEDVPQQAPFVGGVQSLAAGKIGPGVATIPGFRGYVTASNGELGIGQLPNGRYGVCTDTGAQFPWPSGGLSLTTVNAPRTAYLLSHYMDNAIGNPRMAAALWWATGLTFGQNSQPAAMRSHIDRMQAESPGIYADVLAIHNTMVNQANRYASPTGGYTVSVNVANDSGSPDGITVSGIGVRSGADWVPETPMTLTLEGARFNSNGAASINIDSGTGPLTLRATQSGPGIVRVNITARDLADNTYQVWHGGGATQHVLARGDYVNATASDATTQNDTGRARARKVDAVSGAPLQGAVFNVWGETDGNEAYNAGTDGMVRSLTTGSQGYTAYYQWFNAPGAQVCFRETQAPAGYRLDRTVRCIRPGSLTATVTRVIENTEGPPVQDPVPIAVYKSTEDGDPAGMIGVTVAIRLGTPDGPTLETHTFTAADITNGQAVWVTRPIYESTLNYYVVVIAEPPGWMTRNPVQLAWLNGSGTFFRSAFMDERVYNPSIVTQVSAQRSTFGQVVHDVVRISGLPGIPADPILGHWRLLGPIAPRASFGEVSCTGLDWSAAEIFDEGTFNVDWRNPYHVGHTALYVPGCYTYIERLDASPTSTATEWTPAGIVEETTLQVFRPSIVTEVSDQKVEVGETIRDRVTVTGTGGQLIPGRWHLYGPVAPVRSVPAGQERTVDSCTRVDWSTAPLAAEGDFTVLGDNTVTLGEHTVTAAGCYTYTTSLEETSSTQAVPETPRGERSETTIATRTPTLETRVSFQRVEVGQWIHDTVMIRGLGSGPGGDLGSARPSGVWTLLGPMRPVIGADKRPSCRFVNWTDPANPSPVAATGTFLADRGDGDYVVGQHHVQVAGCYTYVEDLTGTPTTEPLPPTRPGIVEETTVGQHTPQLRTQISDQMGAVGAVISDQVFITGLGRPKQTAGGPPTGISIPGHWQLLGPVAPVLDPELGRTCDGVNWTGPEDQVPIAGAGNFTVTGDGTYVVGEHTVKETGCYTYVEWLDATPISLEVPKTTAGLPEETTMITALPRIITQISSQRSKVGDTIVDTVKLEGTEGAAYTAQWKLLGPVSPVWDGAALSCTGLDWSSAAIAAAGEFDTMGDGTYTVGKHTLEEAGCYTYVEWLPTTPTTDGIGTMAGIPDETTLTLDYYETVSDAYSERSEDGESRDDSSDDDSRDDSSDGDRLPGTGAPEGAPALLFTAVLLMLGGGGLVYASRTTGRPAREPDGARTGPTAGKPRVRA